MVIINVPPIASIVISGHSSACTCSSPGGGQRNGARAESVVAE